MPKKPTYKIAFTRFRTAKGQWEVDPALRPMLVQDAKAHGISLTQMATKILAEKYNFPFETTQRETRSPSADGDVFNLRLPAKLYDVIGQRAWPASVPDAVRATLSSHYGLRLPAKVKQTRRRAAA